MSYEWVIKDTNSFFSTRNCGVILSKSFRIDGVRWILKVYPNGWKKNNKGYCSIFLELVAKSNKWKKLSISSELTCLNTGSQWDFNRQFEQDDYWGKDDMVLVSELRQSLSQNKHSITFRVAISILDYLDANGKSCAKQPKKPNNKQIRANSDPLEIRIESISTYLDATHTKMKKINEAMQQMQRRLDDVEKKENENMSAIMDEFSSLKCAMQNKQKQENMIYPLQVRVESISTYLGDTHTTMQRMQETMQEMQRGLDNNNVQKKDDNQLNSMMNEFASLKQTVNMLSNQSAMQNKQNQSPISDWLTNVIGKPQYIDLFIEQDIDMDVLMDMTEQDMQAMGVSKMGDRKRIMKGIQFLKSKNKQKNEGLNESNYV